MAGPVSNTPPAGINWQVQTPAPAQPAGQSPAPAGQPLNLELSPEALRSFSLPTQDSSVMNRSYPSDGFNHGIQFNTPPADHPMTRGEFVDNVRSGLRDSLGENGASTVEALAGAAYLANGGKVKVSHDTTVFNQPAQIDFSASARHGGTVGIGFRMNLGGK